jgi:hypothetical protein
VKVHEGKCWIWYARQDQYGEHQKDIERFFDYADRACEYLTGAWGLKPHQEKYALLVSRQTGGGFAAGDPKRADLKTAYLRGGFRAGSPQHYSRVQVKAAASQGLRLTVTLADLEAWPPSAVSRSSHVARLRPSL